MNYYYVLATDSRDLVTRQTLLSGVGLLIAALAVAVTIILSTRPG